MLRELYTRYSLTQNNLNPLEVFAHEVYLELGCLFCFTDRGSECNGVVLCRECVQGAMRYTETDTPEARLIERYYRIHAPVGIDYANFMIAGDIYLELQDK